MDDYFVAGAAATSTAGGAAAVLTGASIDAVLWAAPSKYFGSQVVCVSSM